jgi:hypothetical protein
MTCAPDGVVDREDTTGSLTSWRRTGARHGSVLVLRPAKVVFGVTDGMTDELTRTLVAQLGLGHPVSAAPSAAVAAASR